MEASRAMPIHFSQLLGKPALQPSIILRSAEPGKHAPAGDELWLRDQALDRQIVDIEGWRLVRVNDLQLASNRVAGRFCLAGVDTGTRIDDAIDAFVPRPGRSGCRASSDRSGRIP